ncbi:ABC transporter ATP-binding protein [Cohnella nanjingensis]|uniref:ABC transporter ATP-binding protein n=1 Tax=Cohnella nanjingensis TaxID=1387779 RepID=A0A7X0RN67_9BACL|nr:ABC transporter ATP-binding protein [Cohnella nanjingensis]MBB6670623.1 ABC transporter ATP-binding protein [Cohnella nanjingensis]
MSSDVIISFQNVSKSYRMYKKPNDRLKQMLWGSRKQYYEDFWAIKDISFDVKKGETYGLIGRNGSGKSTTLQILAGTLTPTTGKIEIKGKIAALLELGSGFNPEFTGKENVLLNAAIWGLSKKEIEERYEEIVAFAEIGDFIDQPVKTYSSGMYVRLAFAVAVHTEPDILIVDEALSVGDAMFQHKCMAKIKKMVSKGVTLFFVSHSPEAVRSLCTKAIWLENGSIRSVDDAVKISNSYLNEIYLENNRIVSSDQQSNEFEGSAPSTTSFIENTSALDIDKMDVLDVRSIQLLNQYEQFTESLEQNEPFTIKVQIYANADFPNLSVGMLLRDQYGIELTGESTFNKFQRSFSVKKNSLITISFKSIMLLRGGESYSINLRLNQVSKWDRSDNIHIYNDETAYVFKVIANLKDPMWFKFKQDFEVDIDVR